MPKPKDRDVNDKHIRFSLLWAACNNVKQAHPQVVMKELGMEYSDSTPQSIGDCWWFWNCENIPDPLPPYLSVAGLSDEDYYYWCK